MLQRNYEQGLNGFIEAVKALIRTEDLEQRKNLRVPLEYVLWIKCRDKNTLPLSGGALNQPFMLMMCFDIIDNELRMWQEEKAESKKKLDEANQRLREAHQKRNR